MMWYLVKHRDNFTFNMFTTHEIFICRVNVTDLMSNK
jgi:hypothetical protein